MKQSRNYVCRRQSGRAARLAKWGQDLSCFTMVFIEKSLSRRSPEQLVCKECSRGEDQVGSDEGQVCATNSSVYKGPRENEWGEKQCV